MIAVGGCSTVRRIAGPHDTFLAPHPLPVHSDSLRDSTHLRLCKRFCMPTVSVTSAKERSVAERSVAGTPGRQS
jgi:hypothetical protein